jgi:hypothetical protein
VPVITERKCDQDDQRDKPHPSRARNTTPKTKSILQPIKSNSEKPTNEPDKHPGLIHVTQIGKIMEQKKIDNLGQNMINFNDFKDYSFLHEQADCPKSDNRQ